MGAIKFFLRAAPSAEKRGKNFLAGFCGLVMSASPRRLGRTAWAQGGVAAVAAPPASPGGVGALRSTIASSWHLRAAREGWLSSLSAAQGSHGDSGRKSDF